MSQEEIVSDPAPVPGIITVFGRTTRAMLAELVERLHQAGYPAVQAAFHPVSRTSTTTAAA